MTNKCTRKRTRIGQWNVRSLYQAGSLALVELEMERYKLELLGLSEVRYNQFGELTTSSGNMLLYSGMPNANDVHQHGVGFLLGKAFKNALLGWTPVSERIISARFKTKFRKVTVVQCYAPTNQTEMEIKENFYSLLDKTLSEIKQSDIVILMGDFNAKVGTDNIDLEHIMGREGVGEKNENGELLIELCGNHNLRIGGTMFPHHDCHKVTWNSPDHESN